MGICSDYNQTAQPRHIAMSKSWETNSGMILNFGINSYQSLQRDNQALIGHKLNAVFESHTKDLH